MWRPGGGLDQLRPLLKPLRVTEIDARDARVVAPELAQQDTASTWLFQRALELLREDLQRNDPQLAEGLAVPWDTLAQYAVGVQPSLTLAVGVAPGREYECDVRAKVDTTRATVFVSDPAELARVDGGGRALAALFGERARLVAQAWRAACDKAEEGIGGRPVDLASDIAGRDMAEFEADRRLADVQKRTARKHRSSRGARGRSTGEAQPSEGSGGDSAVRTPAESGAALRTLVDPRSLVLVDAEGRIHRGSGGAAAGAGERRARGGVLKEPQDRSSGPRTRSPLRGYTDAEREDVGIELLRMLLDTEQDEIVDLRRQRGVGADAVDQMAKYYELKVSAGPEPDVVTLTDAEVQRALTTPDFFLVVVSNVEGADARPTVRLVVDPLKQLRPTDRGTIHLSGVRRAGSLVYEFAPIDDEPSPDEGT